MHLEALIFALEEATGPDREMDAAIVKALYPDAFVGVYVQGEFDPIVMHAEPLVPHKHDLPAFTASIDAALTLVPEGWKWALHSADDRSSPVAYIVPNMGRLPWPEWVDDIVGATPAIALCIAALKARKELAQ